MNLHASGQSGRIGRSVPSDVMSDKGPELETAHHRLRVLEMRWKLRTVWEETAPVSN